MAETLPWAVNVEETEASVARRAVAGVLGAPLGSFSEGISVTTAGGGHGVVADGDLAVSQHAGTPGMSVDVAVGTCFVRGSYAADAGVYVASNTSVLQLTIDAAHATNARKDLIVARMYDAEYSGVVSEFQIEVVTGTPAGSPADPTVPENSLVLARVNVAALASSIVNANITDLRTFAAALGGIQRCTAATRPTGASLYEGLQICEIDTGYVLQWDGAAWSILHKLVGSGVVQLEGVRVHKAVDKLYTATVSGAVTIDANNGPKQRLTVNGNITSLDVANFSDGQEVAVTFINDGSVRTNTLNAAWRYPSGKAVGAATYSTAANAWNSTVIERAGSDYVMYVSGDVKT